jgi:hypothetical protein
MGQGKKNKRPRILNYSVQAKGPKSGQKTEKAIACYQKLLRRTAVEGKTLWIENALKVVSAKLKKYSINIHSLS